MPLILHIETSTEFCSVAISLDREVIFETSTREERSHASLLAVQIRDALRNTNLDIKSFHAIAVSKGPGSYTGLRIGVSTAKGLCYASGLPLIAINTLQCMTVEAIQKTSSENNIQDALFCPMIDARRMEVYTTVFDYKLQQLSDITASIINQNTFNDWLEKKPVYFFGNGSEKCQKTINHPNAHFIKEIFPLARNMTRLAEKSYNEKHVEDLAYFEPFYLKDFITTVPKKKLFF